MIQHETTRAQLAPPAPLVPGVDALCNIIAGKRTWWYRITIEADVVIGTADALSIINQGRLAALFQYIGISENGQKYVQAPAKALANLSDKLFASVGVQRHLPTVAHGATVYHLVDEVFIPLAWPLSPRPWETAYLEINPQLQTYVFLTPWSGTGTTAITNGNKFLVAPDTTTTCTISNLTVRVIQEFDDNTKQLPLFRPRYEFAQSPAITGPIVDTQFNIQYQRALRAMMMEQTVLGAWDVNDILTGHQLRTDATLIDGFNGDINTADEINDQARLFTGLVNLSGVERDIVAAAGAIPATAPAWFDDTMLLRMFSRERISQCLNLIPGTAGYAGPNFRMLATGDASAVSGTSVILFSFFALERIPGVTVPKLPPGLGLGA